MGAPLALLLGGCGSISFGDPFGPVDGGVEPDLGLPDVPDLGLPDVVEYPDVPPVDVGCEPIEPGPFPSDWPFDRTTGGYTTYFFDPIVAEATLACGTGICHGPLPTGHLPYIPETSDLIEPNVEQLVSELWASVPYQDRNGMMVRPILWKHSSMGGNQIPRFDTDDPKIMEALEAFVALVESCSWAPVFANPPQGPPECSEDGGTPVDAGLPPDAGDVDGGDADAADLDAAADAGPVDTGPADTGAATVVCPCPLPDVDLSHCAAL